MSNLNQKNILLIAADGFQQEEFFEPMNYMREQGANVHVASMEKKSIKADTGEQREYTPELTFSDVNVDDYDGLIIPGGLRNPDTLRQQDEAVQIVRDFGASGKVIGAICHGPWLLAEADIVKGREMTSYPSIKTDLRNAGAQWTDSEVIADNGIVTSRNPDDIPAFNRKLVEELNESRHDRNIESNMKRAA